MWGDGKTAAAKRTIGKGTLFTCTAADTVGMALDSRGYRTPYVKYETIATALAAQGVRPDFRVDVTRCAIYTAPRTAWKFTWSRILLTKP